MADQSSSKPSAPAADKDAKASSKPDAKASAGSSKADEKLDELAALDPNELRTAQAIHDANERAKNYLKGSDRDSGDVYGMGVYDHDARDVVQVFNSGDDKVNKRDAAGYLGRLVGKSGESAERDLSIVKIVEA